MLRHARNSKDTLARSCLIDAYTPETSFSLKLKRAGGPQGVCSCHQAAFVALIAGAKV